MLRVVLESQRYRVVWSRRGRDGLAEGVRWRPEIVILELDLPDMDGFAVLQSFREWSNAPLMILSGRTGIADKVRALDAGANDYMLKPFAPEELAARLRVLLRNGALPDDGPIFLNGALRIDMATREVTVNGRALAISATEEAVLHILARHAGKIVPWRRIVRAIWGADAATKIHDLQVHISRLRRKFAMQGVTDVIMGHSALGYTLSLSSDCRSLVARHLMP
jgi:two-component system, OmpR family, KDP operon response regulator KdpE